MGLCLLQFDYQALALLLDFIDTVSVLVKLLLVVLAFVLSGLSRRDSGARRRVGTWVLLQLLDQRLSVRLKSKPLALQVGFCLGKLSRQLVLLQLQVLDYQGLLPDKLVLVPRHRGHLRADNGELVNLLLHPHIVCDQLLVALDHEGPQLYALL